jgi:hypothetical protein
MKFNLQTSCSSRKLYRFPKCLVLESRNIRGPFRLNDFPVTSYTVFDDVDDDNTSNNNNRHNNNGVSFNTTTQNSLIHLCSTVYNELPLKNKHLNINWLNVYSFFHNSSKIVFSGFTISVSHDDVLSYISYLIKYVGNEIGNCLLISHCELFLPSYSSFH